MIKSYARDIIILRIVLKSTKRGNLCLKSSQSQTRKAAWVKQPLASISQLISQSWASAFLPSTSTRRATAAADSASKKIRLNIRFTAFCRVRSVRSRLFCPLKSKDWIFCPQTSTLPVRKSNSCPFPNAKKCLKRRFLPFATCTIT